MNLICVLNFKKKSKKNLIICLLIAFFAIEVCLQSLALMPADDVLTENPLTHHDYRPGITFLRRLNRLDGFHFVINRINNFGIRGPAIRKKMHPRILLIGDSFIQADEVDFQDTFSETLNKHFQGELEFIAHGIGSWSPTTEFSWIYHKGMNLFPDEINIFLCANDFFRRKTYESSDACYQQLAMYTGNIPVKYKIKKSEDENLLHRIRNLFKKIKLIRFTYRCFKSLICKRPYIKEEISLVANEFTLFSQDATEWPTTLKESVDATIDVIKKLQNYLERHNITFNVLLVPLGFEWENENIYGKEAYGWPRSFMVSQRGLEEYLKMKLKELNINYIDLPEVFRKKKCLDNATLLFNKFDAHWNKNGHQLVFEVLRNYYSEKL